MIAFGLATECHAWGTDIHLITGDRIIFDIGRKVTSEPATRWGTLDMYRTRMTAEAYQFNDGFPLVFKE